MTICDCLSQLDCRPQSTTGTARSVYRLHHAHPLSKDRYITSTVASEAHARRRLPLSMHHELFLALLGHTGDVVERRVDGFFVRPDARSFLSQAQCSVLNQLLQLGYSFSNLSEFIRDAPPRPSVYLHAVAHALEQVLYRYTEAVVALEAKTLQANAVGPMTSVLVDLDEFVEVLPQVDRLVQRLQRPQPQVGSMQHATCVKGAELLSLVHRSSRSGFPRVQTVMQELLHCCHRCVQCSYVVVVASVIVGAGRVRFAADRVMFSWTEG